MTLHFSMLNPLSHIFTLAFGLTIITRHYKALIVIGLAGWVVRGLVTYMSDFLS